MPLDASTVLALAATVAAILLVATTLHVRSDVSPLHRSVAVVVLGDVGRSPRIMYHAQSFASNDFETYVIGYKGSRVIPSLLTIPRVRFVYLPEPPSFISKLPRHLFLLLAPIKVVYQLVTIFSALFYSLKEPPQYILVQNPPSIPTLALVWLAGKLRGSKVIIDWHNLGYSILALKLGDKHILVRFAKRFEQFFGKSAFAHVFVTQAMRDYLVKEWNLQGKKIVLHDRPPAHFHSCLPSEVHDLFLRLSSSLDPTLGSFFPSHKLPESTAFTTLAPAATSTSIYPSSPLHNRRPERPALIVSSTSWTADEDFSILLDALSLYEKEARSQEGRLPKVFCVVTGKGPLREHYMRKVHELEQDEKWQFVRCRSLWLEPEDYPLLLGAADLGVSLHSSSSALDLPMKIVDMFGCELPVLALDFKCLNELVLDGKNGLVFKNAEELAFHLTSILASFPHSAKLAALKSYFKTRHPEWEWCSWSENWNQVLRPVVTNDSAPVVSVLEELSRDRN
ncbi:glycosyltransferase family 33 protein [Sphaerobolus stellatus SS14]|uniref:Chitobiosyldiphosphodolichol beta-mannosyltransferase n=1 Tax=Sphaerobolus stellatus (strain SS14) TaxID=990650 RepID=A0A0C9W0U0_SPHS4|nr:glycosyltransferase family 33 protein [Sphaerobolus stellatus SS14]